MRYRLQQFLTYLFAHPSDHIDQELQALVPFTHRHLITRLSPGDRRHLLTTARVIIGAAPDNLDLIQAAVLHDTGKNDGIAHVRLNDRIVRVLMNRWFPKLIRKLATPGSPPFCHQLYLADHHAVIGAMLAEQAGSNAHVCWLIAHHHDDTIHDDDLRLLQIADEELD